MQERERERERRGRARLEADRGRDERWHVITSLGAAGRRKCGSIRGPNCPVQRQDSALQRMLQHRESSDSSGEQDASYMTFAREPKIETKRRSQ